MNNPCRPSLKNVSHVEWLDPEALQKALGPSVSVKWFRGLEPDGGFCHPFGSLSINAILLVSDAGTALEFLVDDTPGLHLLACFQGRLHLETAAGEVALGAKDCALLPSGFRRGNGHYSLASLTIEPSAVAAAAAAMAGLPEGLTRPVRDRDMFPPLALSPEHPSTLAIHGLLRHLDACLPVGPKVALVCGYQHVGHFSRDFKTRFGIKPSQARRA